MLTEWTHEKRILLQYKMPYPKATQPQPKWTDEQTAAWRDNLRRMGLVVDDNKRPYTGKE